MLGKDYTRTHTHTHKVLYYTENMTHNFASRETFAKAKLPTVFQTKRGGQSERDRDRKRK